MNTLNRRQFVRRSALASFAAPAILKAAGADKINLAFIGPGGMGTNHINTMCKRDDVIYSWVCDADSKKAEAAAKKIQELTGQTPKITKDMRQVFDDKAVQAVLMATPDHWHAPGAILAANAGKHVYVEKPCSHNLHEGRLMIEAAAKNKVAMQVGTQSRSTASISQIIENCAAASSARSWWRRRGTASFGGIKATSLRRSRPRILTTNCGWAQSQGAV